MSELIFLDLVYWSELLYMTWRLIQIFQLVYGFSGGTSSIFLDFYDENFEVKSKDAFNSVK